MDLFAALLVSSIGLGYFIYGKKIADFHFLLAGIALMIYPYFFTGMLLIVIGIILLAAPFVIKRYF